MHMANQKILTCQAETPHPLLICPSLVYRIPWNTQCFPSDAPMLFSNAPDPQTHMMPLIFCWPRYLTHLYGFLLCNPLQLGLNCPPSRKNPATFCFAQRKIFPPNIDEELQKGSAGNNSVCCRQCPTVARKQALSPFLTPVLVDLSANGTWYFKVTQL